MAGYLGSVPVPQATQHRESFTCTEGQTSFATAGYTAQFVDVYLNGSHLSPADFTATNGSDVVLAVAASADDVCDIISYTPFEVANQTFTGTTNLDAVDIDGAVQLDSTLTVGVDDTGYDVKFFGATASAYMQWDASTDDLILGGVARLGIGTDSPAEELHISTATPAIKLTDTSDNTDNRIIGSNGGVLIYAADENDEASGSLHRFDIDGGEAFRINANLDMGLGTDGTLQNSSGFSTLTLNGSTGGQISFHTGNAAKQYIYSNSTNLNIFNGVASGNLKFFTASTERLNIDAIGAVTMPFQPAFLATVNDTQSNLAVGSDVKIKLGTELFDNNADFTVSTGDGQGGDGSNLTATFTAPVTGKYQLNLMLRLRNVDAASAYYIVSIHTSNRLYRFIYDPDFGQDAVYWATSLSVLADMDTSDTAFVSVNQQGGTAQTDVDNGPEYTVFSGYLVA